MQFSFSLRLGLSPAALLSRIEVKSLGNQPMASKTNTKLQEFLKSTATLSFLSNAADHTAKWVEVEMQSYVGLPEELIQLKPWVFDLLQRSCARFRGRLSAREDVMQDASRYWSIVCVLLGFFHVTNS
jgi:hypothetical protein